MITLEYYKDKLALAMEALQQTRDSVCLAMGSGYDLLEARDSAEDTSELDMANNSTLDAVDTAIKALISFGDLVDARICREDGR